MYVNDEKATSPRDELVSQFKSILESYQPVEHGKAVSVVDAMFAYRLLLGRMPSSDIELSALCNLNGVTYREFMNGLLDSIEFRKQSAFIPGGHMFMSELSRFRFWFRTSDREMGFSMATGQYEPETVDLLPKLVAPTDFCLDIGAQTGFFSMHLASLVGEDGGVYSFEPLHANFEVLDKNTRENKFSNIIRAYQVGCSDHEGELDFIHAAGMLVASNDSQDSERVSVKCIRPDDVVERRISFVKLDVEGHEPMVLGGMSRILSDRPLILTELNEYWLRRAGWSGRSYMELLTSKGYTLMDITTREWLDGSSASFEELDAVNILAIPNERSDEVRAAL